MHRFEKQHYCELIRPNKWRRDGSFIHFFFILTNYKLKIFILICMCPFMRNMGSSECYSFVMDVTFHLLDYGKLCLKTPFLCFKIFKKVNHQILTSALSLGFFFIQRLHINCHRNPVVSMYSGLSPITVQFDGVEKSRMSPTKDMKSRPLQRHSSGCLVNTKMSSLDHTAPTVGERIDPSMPLESQL